MAKTTFSKGRRVSADWFNSIQSIEFDDLDIDGHYSRLTDDALTEAAGNIKPEFYSMRDAGKVTFVSGLNISVAACTVTLQNGTRVSIPSTQLTVANGSRIISVDNNGALQVAGSAPETGVMLARVVSSGGVVTTITDLRSRTNFQVQPITVAAATQFVMPPGSVMEYAGSTAPTGWLFCDGSEVSRTTYAALFAAIGVVHGTPSNNTVFKLPDRRDRVGRGVGTSTALGATGGNDSITLSTAQMPAHTHTLTDNGHSHSINDPGHSHNVLDGGHTHPINLPKGGSTGSGVGENVTNTVEAPDFVSTQPTGASLSNIAIQGHGSNLSINASGAGITMASVGNGAAVDIRNRFVGMNYIIKT